ncbi:antA/AntB antirepressor family protein [Spirosoma oryzicola]|uniref:antA/AntB antirepressor family protein n=1 Tax=Spirosoma oryzicola TaxID=2898794 RepID=UPI001E529EBB|nr:antA/AntB antirepressor family protein [Spirosoma oryzicola]UHG93243.1 antA/AntB antirepressor family protein [Spirosoma oryzicola]
MNSLIAITSDGQGSSVVSARELHSFLESKQQFADWIKNRIIKYGFLEEVDYVTLSKNLETDNEEGFSENSEKLDKEVFHKSMKNPKGGRVATDYALTLDMAKQLAMVEKTEKGRQARLYFIDAEKALRKTLSTPPAVPSTEQVLIQLVAQSNQLLANQQEQLSQLRADMDSIMRGQRPTPQRKQIAKPTPRLVGPPRANPLTGALRSTINKKVGEYCGYHGAEQGATYNYLYKRMNDVYGVNVYRLNRAAGESLLDALEQYGQLEKLYSLIMAELTYVEE